MCHKLAEKLIIWCEGDNEFDGYEHIKAVYGIEVFLESLWKLIGLLVLGCMVENRQMFFVSIVCFSLLRCSAGGRHSKSSIICFLCMASVGLVPAYILEQWVIPNIVSALFFVIAFALLLIYAPHMSHTVDNTKERKMLALFLTTIYLFLFLIIPDQGIRNAVLFGTLAETITLIEGGQREVWKKGMHVI